MTPQTPDPPPAERGKLLWKVDAREWAKDVAQVAVFLGVAKVLAVARVDPQVTWVLLSASPASIVATVAVISVALAVLLVAIAFVARDATHRVYLRAGPASRVLMVSGIVIAALGVGGLVLDGVLRLFVSALALGIVWGVHRIQVARERDDRTDRFLIGLAVAFFLFALVRIAWAGLEEPWMPREVLRLDSGDELDGYVVEDSGRWMTLLTHEGRDVVVVEVDAVQERVPWAEP